jgi:hypothetical protein
MSILKLKRAYFEGSCQEQGSHLSICQVGGLVVCSANMSKPSSVSMNSLQGIVNLLK